MKRRGHFVILGLAGHRRPTQMDLTQQSLIKSLLERGGQGSGNQAQPRQESTATPEPEGHGEGMVLQELRESGVKEDD